MQRRYTDKAVSAEVGMTAGAMRFDEPEGVYERVSASISVQPISCAAGSVPPQLLRKTPRDVWRILAEDRHAARRLHIRAMRGQIAHG